MITPPGTEFHRVFETDGLEVRSAAKGGDGRTVEGLAVPYLVRQRIDHSLTEQFAPGAFDHQLGKPGRVFFTRDHQRHGGTIIGKAIELRNDKRGLWGAFRVSATPAGDETLELVKDGVLTQMSVGFRAGRDHIEPDGTVTRVRVDLREVSMVPIGAYGEAASVLAVRAGEQPHTTTYPQRSTEFARILASLPELPPMVDA